MEDIEDLGPCCCCGGTRDVRNIVMLPRRCSVPGTGWSCLVCGLPADGAIYAACDRCVESDIPPRQVVKGFAASGEREWIDDLPSIPFDHDPGAHGT
jgi:hypothetical protein